MMKPEGYAAIPTWMLRDETISAPALLVYASLASWSGFESVHPGQASIAKDARVSERRVRDAIKELEALGVLERVERRHRSGARATDGYVLLSNRRPSAIAAQPAASAGCDDLPADSDTTNRQIPTLIPPIEITREEITNVTSSTRDDVSALLDLLDTEIAINDPRKVPKRNQGNENAMRLLIDRDGYSVEEISAVIRWAQADQFWHANILSASKLRKQFSTLHSQMNRSRAPGAHGTPASRALSVDLTQSPTGSIIGSQNGVQRAAGPSIIGEIEGGRF